MTRYIVACYNTMREIYMDVVALNRWIRRQLGEKAWWLGGWKRLWSSNSFVDPMKSVKDQQIIRRRLIYIYIISYIYILEKWTRGQYYKGVPLILRHTTCKQSLSRVPFRARSAKCSWWARTAPRYPRYFQERWSLQNKINQKPCGIVFLKRKA